MINSLEKKITSFITFLSVLALCYFSFYPIELITSAIKVPKIVGFVLIAICISLLIFLKFILNNFRFDFNAFLIFVGYLVFALYALLSFLIVGDILEDSYNIRTVLIVNPFFIILSITTKDSKRLILILLYILSGVYFLIVITTFLQGDLSVLSYLPQYIFGGKDGMYQGINMYLGMFALINLILFIDMENLYFSTFFLVCFIITLFSMLLIGGRAGFVSLIFCSFCMAYFMFNNIKGKKICLLALTGFIISVLVIKNLSVLSNTITIVRLLDVMSFETDNSYRIFLFSSAIDLFSETWKTIIFGAGMNTFPEYIKSYSTGMYPHNIILEILAEIGLLGFLLFMAPLLYVLLLRVQTYGSIVGKCTEEIGIFGIALFYSISFLFTGGLRFSWPLLFYIVLLLPVVNYNEKTDYFIEKHYEKHFRCDDH